MRSEIADEISRIYEADEDTGPVTRATQMPPSFAPITAQWLTASGRLRVPFDEALLNVRQQLCTALAFWTNTLRRWTITKAAIASSGAASF